MSNIDTHAVAVRSKMLEHLRAAYRACFCKGTGRVSARGKRTTCDSCWELRDLITDCRTELNSAKRLVDEARKNLSTLRASVPESSPIRFADEVSATNRAQVGQVVLYQGKLHEVLKAGMVKPPGMGWDDPQPVYTLRMRALNADGTPNERAKEFSLDQEDNWGEPDLYLEVVGHLPPTATA